MERKFRIGTQLLALFVSASVLSTSCSQNDDLLNELQDDVIELQDEVSTLKDATSALKTAVDQNKSITAYDALPDNAGWKITFSDGETLDILNGKAGSNGVDGVSITPVLKVDSDGHWVVSVDNGATFTKVNGADGNPVNATGDKGEAGNDGAQGDQGDKGDQGNQGDQGDKGDKGDQGNQGDQGDQGDKGDQGNQGDQGDKGDKGDQGNQGEAGKDGSKVSIDNTSGTFVIVITDYDGKVTRVDTKIPVDSKNIISSIIENEDGTITITTADEAAFEFGVKFVGISSIIILSDDLEIRKGATNDLIFRVSPSTAVVSMETSDYILDEISSNTRAGYATKPSKELEITAVEKVSIGQYKVTIAAKPSATLPTTDFQLSLVVKSTDVKNEEAYVTSPLFYATVPNGEWNKGQIEIKDKTLQLSQIGATTPFEIDLGTISLYDPATTKVTFTSSNSAVVLASAIKLTKGEVAASTLKGTIGLVSPLFSENYQRFVETVITATFAPNATDKYSQTFIVKVFNTNVTVNGVFTPIDFVTPGDENISFTSQGVLKGLSYELELASQQYKPEAVLAMIASLDGEVMPTVVVKYALAGSEPILGDAFTAKMELVKDDKGIVTDLIADITAIKGKLTGGKTYALDLSFILKDAADVPLTVTYKILAKPTAIIDNAWVLEFKDGVKYTKDAVITNEVVDLTEEISLEGIVVKNGNTLVSKGFGIKYYTLPLVDGKKVFINKVNMVDVTAPSWSKEVFVELNYGGKVYDVAVKSGVTSAIQSLTVGFKPNTLEGSNVVLELEDNERTFVYKSGTVLDFSQSSVSLAISAPLASQESIISLTALNKNLIKSVVMSVKSDVNAPNAKYIVIDGFNVKSAQTTYDLNEDKSVTLVITVTDLWGNNLEKEIEVKIAKNK